MHYNKKRRLLLISAGAGIAAAALGTRVHSQALTYPQVPVRFVIPFASGGGTDIVGRTFAKKMSELIGGNIYVENIPGAGGTIGSERVARAKPDGHTLLLSNVASHAIAPGLRELRYDAIADFEHIALFGSFPNALIVKPTFPARNLAEFLQFAKSSRDSIPYGSAGIGSSPHLCGELLKQRTGIPALHIPYKGSAPARVAFLSGEIAFQFENFATAVTMIKNGEARALAVTSESRTTEFPDLPTMQESGISDFVISSWYGLSTPAKIPVDVKRVLAKAAADTLNDAATRAMLIRIGITPSSLPPEGYKKFIQDEIKKMAEIISKGGIKVE